MSSIGAAKTRLVQILGAALPASQVLPGPVGQTTLTDRVLVVGGESTPIQLDISGLDGSSGTEQYTLVLTISVSVPGTDMGVAEDLALADLAAAIAAIRADQSLGIDNLSATVDGNAELAEQAGASGRKAAIRFPVHIFTTF